MAWSYFSITQRDADSTTFWQATAYFHSQLPYLAKNGMMGYYNISATSPYNQSSPLILGGGFWILNTSVAALDGILNPVLNHTSASFPVDVVHATQFVPNLYEWRKVQYPPGPVAFVDVLLGSRLLDEKALSAPLPSLAENLRTAYPKLALLGNLVSGLGVWNAKPPGGLGSMTPAWRKAVVHLSKFNRRKAIENLIDIIPSTSCPCNLELFQYDFERGADHAPHEYVRGGTSENGA